MKHLLRPIFRPLTTVTLIAGLSYAACGGSGSTSVSVQFPSTPPESDRRTSTESVDISFLVAGNTVDSRTGLPPASTIEVDDAPAEADEVLITTRYGGGRISAQDYHPVSLVEGETTTIEASLSERECLAPGAVAKEIINQINLTTLIAGGENAIPDEPWETYVPSPPFMKNSDRFLEFNESCYFRSFEAAADCSGDGCYQYVPLDDYSWLRLSQVACMDNIPASDNSDRVPPPGYVQFIVLKKCQELVFEGEIFEMHDPYGNVYVMHASASGVPDAVTPELPEGWEIRSRVLSEPLILNPRGKECRYNLVKDNLDQSYHQHVFADPNGISEAISAECAEYLDEN